MKVSELIHRLHKFPAEAEILIPSYEEGYDPVTDCRYIFIEKRKNKDWYVGFYDEVNSGDKRAVLITSKFTRSESEDMNDGE